MSRWVRHWCLYSGVSLVNATVAGLLSTVAPPAVTIAAAMAGGMILGALLVSTPAPSAKPEAPAGEAA